MFYVKISFCITLTIALSVLSTAQAPANTGKKVSFFLNGNICTAANFYSSNETFATRPSYSWNAYGNFMARVNNVVIPFSFVANQFGNSTNPIFFQAGMSPTYKWAKLHVGDRYMQFSPLIFEGQTFRGVGLELNPKKFRFATFYGRLNKAVDQDTSFNTFRIPQYSRTGYAAKIGYGNSSRFIDLIYFHAKDDSSSASFINLNSKKNTAARENAVLGLSTKLTFLQKLIFQADFSISGLTQDLGAEEKTTDSSTKKLTKLMSQFLDYNASSVSDFAAQSTLIFNGPNFNSNLSYRRVEPDFKSFGTPYLLNDQELINWTNYFSLARGKFTVNTNLSNQHNNLDKNLATELRTLLGNIYVNAIIDTNYSVNFSYAGYDFKNKSGNIPLNDIDALHQLISQFNLNPSCNFSRGYKLHYISANLGLSLLDDKNKVTSGQASNSNISASLNYTMALTQKYCSFSAGALYSRYKQDVNSSYNSYGGTVAASLQLLKNKNLNVQGNFGYYFNRFSVGTSQGTTSQKNISYSFSSGYVLKKHSFNVFANYIYTPTNRINDLINRTIPYAVASKNFAGGISYAYVF